MFVEGHNDKAYYSDSVQRIAPESNNYRFVYVCGGKTQVYDAYSNILSRFPNCRRVLFFVDKDVDDIVGTTWPNNPRIFVTTCYSIENYIVTRDALKGYFSNHLKVNRANFDLSQISEHFESELQKFYLLIRPIMAWIIVMRRSGLQVNLADVSLGKLFSLQDSGLKRQPRRKAHHYLMHITGLNSKGVWKQIRRTCKELSLQHPKRYVRGKFEGGWFLQYIRKMCDEACQIAREGGGSVSIQTQLSANNYVQILCSAIQPPRELDAFLLFHLRTEPPNSEFVPGERKPSVLRRFLNFFSR